MAYNVYSRYYYPYYYWRPLPGGAQAAQGIAASINRYIDQRREELLQRRQEEARRYLEAYDVLLRNPTMFTKEQAKLVSRRAGLPEPQVKKIQKAQEKQLARAEELERFERGLTERQMGLAEQREERLGRQADIEAQATQLGMRYQQLRNQDLQARLERAGREGNIEPGDVRPIYDQIQDRYNRLLYDLGYKDPLTDRWVAGNKPSERDLDEVMLQAENEVLDFYSRFGIKESNPFDEAVSILEGK